MKLLTCSKSDIALLKVQLVAATKNLLCSIPTNGQSIYDIILDDNNGHMYRGQIKFCNRLKNKTDHLLELNLVDHDGNRKFYSKSDVDLLLVYIERVDTVLCYNSDIFHKKKTIHINLKDKNSKFYWEKYIW